MVAIAGVLAMNPKVLILDEPTAGLDPKGRDEILATIKKLHEENKEMIIIFVSHSMEDVAKTAERVIVMNDGHVEMQGTVAEVFAQAEHLQKIGLNVPQVTLLTDKLRLATTHSAASTVKTEKRTASSRLCNSCSITYIGPP